MKKKIKNKSFEIRNYKLQQKDLDKVLDKIKQYQAGKVKARTLDNNQFKVLDVTRNVRIVIPLDNDSLFHAMSHERYNNFFNKRY